MQTDDVAQQIVAVAAASVANRYRGFVERDDLAQEMWIWVLTHQVKVIEWLDVEEKADREAGEAALRLTLRRVGEQYARQQKASMVGYSTLDEYFYDVSVVEDLLPEAFGDSDGWLPAVVEEGGGHRTPRLLNEGNDRWAKVADVQSALTKLSREEFDRLEMKYRFGLTFRQIAERMRCSKSQAHRDSERALSRLVDELGGRSPWNTKERVYTRSVVSNAQAIAALGEQ